MKPKTIKKMSAMDLAHKCGVHIDTIYRTRRNGYSTYRMARLLSKATGIDVDKWMAPTLADEDPWEDVLKKTTNKKR
jgi:DNA-binding MurR/RpiR family transcriptional regulator